MAEGSPTVRSRELGRRLRELRTAQGLTVEEVAEKLLCSAAKISRAETGARRQTLRDVRDLCALYSVGPEETAELMELTKEARQQGWWAEYSDLKIPQLIGYEQEATAITCFGMYFVHALLQTEDYAAAIIKAVAPKISPEILRQRVEARMRRQQLLERPNRPRYRVLLDETVLRRPFGSGAVMQAQLDKMLQLIADEKVTVQIIPYASGAYAAMDSNFDYLEFSDSAMRGLVFVEGLVHMYYFEKEAELARYAEALDYLRDTALSPRDSIRLIEEINREHGRDS